jgi:hypothetical protein
MLMLFGNIHLFVSSQFIWMMHWDKCYEHNENLILYSLNFSQLNIVIFTVMLPSKISLMCDVMLASIFKVEEPVFYS